MFAFAWTSKYDEAILIQNKIRNLVSTCYYDKPHSSLWKNF